MAYTEDFIESRDLTLSDTILIVDIDKTKLSYVNKMAEIPEFPKGYRRTLEKNLQTIKNISSTNLTDETNNQIDDIILKSEEMFLTVF